MSCTAISGRAPGSTSPLSVPQSTWLRVSKPSQNNWGERCCCPARSPTSSKAISISNASANIRCAASTTQSSCLRITAEADLSPSAESPPRGANPSNGHYRRMSVSVVAVASLHDFFEFLVLREVVWLSVAEGCDHKRNAVLCGCVNGRAPDAMYQFPESRSAEVEDRA